MCRRAFITTDSAAALSAGLDGLGIVVLAEFVASHYLASGALGAGPARLAMPVAAAAPGDAHHPQARRTRAGLHGLGALPCCFGILLQQSETSH